MSILTAFRKFADYLDRKGDFDLANIIDKKISLAATPELSRIWQDISNNIKPRALTEIVELSQESESPCSSVWYH